ncbi:MAG: hypothetical protein IKC47_02575 [Clostridia bacterium]|nr:hypothetical protein [Clostridia bacterium]
MAAKGKARIFFEKVFDKAGEVLAFVTLAIYAVWLLNAQLTFITNETALYIIELVRLWAPMLLMAVVGMEFAMNRKFFVRLIVYILIAVIVILMFFPGTWETIRNSVAGFLQGI